MKSTDTPILTKVPSPADPNRMICVQVFPDGTYVRTATHPTSGMRVAKITKPGHVNVSQVVPLDILRLTAGRDAWMRNINIKCDCGKWFPAYTSDGLWCIDCQEAQEQENARLDGRATS